MAEEAKGLRHADIVHFCRNKSLLVLLWANVDRKMEPRLSPHMSLCDLIGAIVQVDMIMIACENE